MTASKDIQQVALDWLLRVNDPLFDDWDGWQAWLDASPEHPKAYWTLAEQEAELVDTLGSISWPASGAAPTAAPTDPRAGGRTRAGRRWTLPALGGLAAALAFGLWLAVTVPGRHSIVESPDGQPMTLALADGSEIALAGGSRIVLDRRNPRFAKLEEGRALFTVVHDRHRPFEVRIGDMVVTDLGTVFDVTRLDQGVRVEVAEGLVRVARGANRVDLEPGEGVMVAPDGFHLRSTPPASVAGWRSSRLTYHDETLSVVVQDLARVQGRRIAVSPDVEDRRFTGSLSADGAVAQSPERLAQLLGAPVTVERDGWRVGAATGH